MIRVKFLMNYPQVKETLSRIGIFNTKVKNRLYPSCLALVDTADPNYGWIAHFKELFKLEGKQANFDDLDLARRDSIVGMLEKWGLVEALDPISPNEEAKFKIVKHQEKDNWEIINKYKLSPNKEKWLVSKIKEG